MDLLIGAAILVAACAVLSLCGWFTIVIFHTMTKTREADRSRRTPLGRLLDTAFRVRR